MAKRILATVAGALAILAGISASSLAIRVCDDFQNPAVGFWPTILGETIVCAAAFVSFGIGIRFLYFGWKGHDKQKPVWIRATLITLGSFFPGFILSLPLAFLYATHAFKDADIALPISLGVGLISSVVCGGFLLKRQKDFLKRK